MLKALNIGLGSYPLSVHQISELTGEGRATIYEKIRGIREQIAAGRYSPYAVIDEKGIRVNFYVYYDYSKWRFQLEDRNAKKYVPPFDAKAIADISPVMQEVIVVTPEGGERRTSHG